MTCCSGSTRYAAAERQFGSDIAKRDLTRYHRKGPDASSRLLLAAVTRQLPTGSSLLDVGGGVGALSFELLAAGARHATLVDASPSYVAVATREAERRGVTGRLRLVTGDFVQANGDIQQADVVVMHRVVCCYPDWTALLDKATRLSRRLVAFSYPRDRWYVRAWLRLENMRRRLVGNDFRSFVHPATAMEGHIAAAGFERLSRSRTPIWCIDVYGRPSSHGDPHPL